MNDRRINSVIVWQNGMVMVFDHAGSQMPDYQGPLEEVGEKLAAVFPRHLWEHRTWEQTP